MGGSIINANRCNPDDAKELREAQEIARQARERRKKAEAEQRRRRAERDDQAARWNERRRARDMEAKERRQRLSGSAATRIKKRKHRTDAGGDAVLTMAMPDETKDSDDEGTLDINSDTSTEFIRPKKAKNSVAIGEGSSTSANQQQVVKAPPSTPRNREVIVIEDSPIPVKCAKTKPEVIILSD
jgi:hypothetical protein